VGEGKATGTATRFPSGSTTLPPGRGSARAPNAGTVYASTTNRSPWHSPAQRRAHRAGEAWDPSDPWRFYPTHEQRVEEAFALMDMRAASELRQAKREAARVLAEHGVHAQVVIDSNATESPHPGPAAGDASPPASTGVSLSSSMPEAAARANPLGAKVRAAFNRWATRSTGTHRASGCGCAACVPGSVRSDDGSRPLDDGHERIRSFATEPRIIG
jgi:hypothetical protein